MRSGTYLSQFLGVSYLLLRKEMLPWIIYSNRHKVAVPPKKTPKELLHLKLSAFHLKYIYAHGKNQYRFSQTSSTVNHSTGTSSANI